jgi:hypothetical protein
LNGVLSFLIGLFRNARLKKAYKISDMTAADDGLFRNLAIFYNEKQNEVSMNIDKGRFGRCVLPDKFPNFTRFHDFFNWSFVYYRCNLKRAPTSLHWELVENEPMRLVVV